MHNEILSAFIRVLPFVAIIIGISIAIKKKRITKDQLDLNKPLSFPRYFLWVLGFLAFVVLTEVIFYNYGLLEVNKWNHEFLPSIIRILGAVILAPVAEELIFRGIILNKLQKRFKVHIAVFIQAIFFVLLHGFTYENTLSSNIGIAQTFIDASLFAYARIYTKSIYTSMSMHITGNLIATLERFIFS